MEAIHLCLLPPALLDLGDYPPLRDGAGLADGDGGLRKGVLLLVALLQGDPALGGVLLAGEEVTDLQIHGIVDCTFGLLAPLPEFEFAHSLLPPLYLPAALRGVAPVSSRPFLAGLYISPLNDSGLRLRQSAFANVLLLPISADPPNILRWLPLVGCICRLLDRIFGAVGGYCGLLHAFHESVGGAHEDVAD